MRSLKAIKAVKAVQSFFINKIMQRQLNHTFLTLIPKVKGAAKWICLEPSVYAIMCTN